MNIKTINKDLKITWEFQTEIPPFLEKDIDFFSNFTFNVKIYDEFNNLIKEEKNLNLSRDEVIQNVRRNSFFVSSDPVPSELMFSRPRSLGRIKTRKKIVKQNYIYPIEENYEAFLKNRIEVGFYKKLKFVISYSEEDYASLNVEYTSLNFSQEELSKLIPSVNKSDDNYGIKLNIDHDTFRALDLNGFYIIPYIYKNNQKIQLDSLLIQDAPSKWLNNNSNIKILTVPLSNERSEEDELFDIKIFPLRKEQESFINFFQMKLNNKDLSIFVEDFFSHQKYNVDLIQKESLRESKIGGYQGYLYLFNNESFNYLKWPNENLEIFNSFYKNYFPLSNKNSADYTISLEPEYEVSQEIPLSNIHDNNIPDDLIGYYISLDNNLIYKNLELDFNYFRCINIRNVAVLDVIEFYSKYRIYIEYATIFDNADDIYVEVNTTNLFFDKKYYKNVDGENKVYLLFYYEYDKVNINNEFQKSRIIQGKKIINFNIKKY